MTDADKLVKAVVILEVSLIEGCGCFKCQATRTVLLALQASEARVAGAYEASASKCEAIARETELGCSNSDLTDGDYQELAQTIVVWRQAARNIRTLIPQTAINAQQARENSLMEAAIEAAAQAVQDAEHESGCTESCCQAGCGVSEPHVVIRAITPESIRAEHDVKEKR